VSLFLTLASRWGCDKKNNKKKKLNNNPKIKKTTNKQKRNNLFFASVTSLPNIDNEMIMVHVVKS